VFPLTLTLHSQLDGCSGDHVDSPVVPSLASPSLVQAGIKRLGAGRVCRCDEGTTGVESDNQFLNEDFNYHITDPTQYDPGTPLNFSFNAQRPDLEQAVYVQDLIRWGNWTVKAGLRWDHYQLILNRLALQPRLAISRYFPSAKLIVHFSYDRVFQTPSFENLLLSSSAAATTLNPISLQFTGRTIGGKLFRSRTDKSVLQ
jgi:outer membrane receptor protein involved in Fe transport